MVAAPPRASYGDNRQPRDAAVVAAVDLGFLAHDAARGYEKHGTGEGPAGRNASHGVRSRAIGANVGPGARRAAEHAARVGIAFLISRRDPVIVGGGRIIAAGGRIWLRTLG